jgi:hypothetical protein
VHTQDPPVNLYRSNGLVVIRRHHSKLRSIFLLPPSLVNTPEFDTI